MVERWYQAADEHPPYCTCAKCELANTRRTAPRSVRTTNAGFPQERNTVRRPATRYPSPRRKQSGVWAVLAVTLLALIAAYLILTVAAPDAIDALMTEWADLFD